MMNFVNKTRIPYKPSGGKRTHPLTLKILLSGEGIILAKRNSDLCSHNEFLGFQNCGSSDHLFYSNHNIYFFIFQ